MSLTWGRFLCAGALVLAGLMVPGAPPASADDIVQITATDVTFLANRNYCLGLLQCAVTVNASVLWNNTSNALAAPVASQPLPVFTQSGNSAFGSDGIIDPSFAFFAADFVPVDSFTGTPELVLRWANSAGDLIYLILHMADPSVAPGLYPLDTHLLPGTFFADVACGTTANLPCARFFTGATPIASSGTVEVTSASSVPEPSSLLLLGTGLLGLAGATLRKKLFA